MGRKVSAVKPVETVSPVSVDKPSKKKLLVARNEFEAIEWLFNRLPRLRYPARRSKSRVTVGELVRYCPGGRHAWYNSSVGLIRKQLA